MIIEEPTDGAPASWLQWLHAEHHPELLERPGTVGAWMYGSTGSWKLPDAAAGPDVYATVMYLDDDPLTTTKALAPLVEQRWATGAVRPLFAGALRSMVEWEAWR